MVMDIRYNKRVRVFESGQSLDLVYGAVSCEDHAVHLRCPLNYRLSVTSAFFGRDDNVTCSETSDVSFSNHSMSDTCDVTGAVETMQLLCDGKRECFVETDAATFDPLNECGDIFKFLRVSFICTCKSNLQSTYSKT